MHSSFITHPFNNFFLAKGILVFSFFMLIQSGLKSQNLENLGGPLFQLSGNIALGSSFYHVEGRDSRRSPFAYFISANPVLSIYGLDIPINIVYRDQQGSISNPFNRYSINPRYKWASLHIGSVTMQMNPYTLSGQVIKGLGVELNPGHIRFAFVTGTMENPLAQLDTIIAGAEILKSYSRKSSAIKFGYGSSRNFLEFSILRAKDDINSIDRNLLNARLVKPEENIVVGSSFKVTPVSWLNLHANLAASAHTANQQALNVFETDAFLKAQDDFSEVISLNFSSKLQFAGDIGFDLTFRSFGIGTEYKRVDPFYRSLGTFYFQEDYENLILKLNFSLFKNKLRIIGRGGLQRNNLSGLRAAKNTRKIASINASVSLSSSLSSSFHYSNFQSERSAGLVELNDSLRFASVTQAYGITPRYSFGDKSRRSTISLSANFQDLNDLLDEMETSRSIKNFTTNLNYGLALREKGLNINLSLLANQNDSRSRLSQRVGLNVRIASKLMDKKLRLNFSSGYMINRMDHIDNGASITARIGAQFKLKKQFSLSLNINYLNRQGSATPYQEYRSNIKLVYQLPKGTNNKS